MISPIVVPPLVWVLLGDKAGDNAQVIAIAQALGWPYHAKQLCWKGAYRISNALLGASLVNLDRGRSDPLEPPWPDLVIGVGRRSVPTARWIRAQTGGRAKLVRVGRPRAPLSLFDLVVTTPQYGLPERPNVLHLTLPLIVSDRVRMGEAARVWQDRLAHLPRPWLALMVGGVSDPFTVTADAARKAAILVDEAAGKAGGSVLVSTSRRTPGEALAEIAAHLKNPHYLHRWRARDPDNPYLAFLALAEVIYVTSDSATMLAEACATGKPVKVLKMPRRRRAWPIRALRAVPGWIARRSQQAEARRYDLGTALARWMIAAGVVRPRRDMERLLDELLERGLAQSALTDRGSPELHLVTARIRALMHPTADTVRQASGAVGGTVS